VTAVRSIREDWHGDLWVGGFGGVGKLVGGKFLPVLDAAGLGGNILTSMLVDRHDNLWLGGTLGLIERSPEGGIQRYTERDGLPNAFVRALWEDRDGNVWVGTNAGLARLEGGRLAASSGEGGFPASWCGACSKTARATFG